MYSRISSHGLFPFAEGKGVLVEQLTTKSISLVAAVISINPIPS